MPAPELYHIFVKPLHRRGVRYMLSGSFASIYYGEPRLTLDVDIVLNLAPDEAGLINELYSEADFFAPPSDIIALELSRVTRGHFNLIHFATGLKADCYPSRSHPYWAWAFERRTLGLLDGEEAWFAPPEYVILWKLEFYREGGGSKHLDDIRGMLEVSGAAIDTSMLDRATAELGLGSQWTVAQTL